MYGEDVVAQLPEYVEELAGGAQGRMRLAPRGHHHAIIEMGFGGITRDDHPSVRAATQVSYLGARAPADSGQL